MTKELAKYLARAEFANLTEWHKTLLARYVRRCGCDVPVGRSLALACMCFNKRYKFERINQAFINWLYTY